ncbi:MAG: hypothetical protein WBV11_03565 [Salegentibacter sp.]
MEVIKIILAAITGTSVMTIFSYIMAYIKNDQFKEPQLLNILINNSETIPLKYSKTGPVGWIAHYVIGTLMYLSFALLWNFTELDVSWISAAFLGIGAGIIGIAGWHLMFYLNARPPEVNLNGFSIQLMIAHLIFSLSGFLVYFYW